MSSRRILFMVEVAILSALALLLDMIPLFKMPQGGSVSLAMVPVFIVAFRWGLKGGLLSGFLLGALQILFGPTILTPLQGFLDYIVAFTALGIAGIFAGTVRNAFQRKDRVEGLVFIALGVFVGSLLRFLAHFTGGIVFFGEYAPEGQPVWLYSLIYNGSYMLPAFAISAAVVYFLFNTQPRTLLKTAA